MWRPRHAGTVAIVGATFTVAPLCNMAVHIGNGGGIVGQCVGACFAVRGWAFAVKFDPFATRGCTFAVKFDPLSEP